MIGVERLLPFLEKRIIIIKPKYQKELKERGYELLILEDWKKIPKDAGTVIIDIDELPKDEALKEFLKEIESSNVKFLIIYGKGEVSTDEILKNFGSFQLGRKMEDLIVLFRKPKEMKEKVIESEPW